MNKIRPQNIETIILYTGMWDLRLLRREFYHVVSATDPYGRILDFQDRNRYYFFQVAPQLYSRG
jgi:hypothetical protein